MSMYLKLVDKGKAEKLTSFDYQSEGGTGLSLQQIIYDNPEMVFDLPELELVNSNVLLCCREYPTVRGNIDLLIIGSNAEVVIIETKLIRNPESTRKVVAQIIDYIKGFSEEKFENFIAKISKYDKKISEKIENNVNFSALINDNIQAGNFKVIVVGDAIHPNVLGMIDSIQSAPHLAFTIHLVDLNTYQLNSNGILLNPSIVSSTVEVERSVIRIQIENTNGDYRVTAETPSKKGRGSKPILSWEQYLSNVVEPEFRIIINDFKEKWIKEIDDSISMGQVGFTAGIEYNKKRLPIQYIYNNRLGLITENMKNYLNIPDEIYNKYIEELKQSDHLLDKYVVSNRAEVEFNKINGHILQHILNTTMNLAKRYKETR